MESNQPSELSIVWDEAKSCTEHGDFGKAVEIYNYILIRYADENVSVEYPNAYLGDVYLTLNKPDLAEMYIKKAIDCSPEKPSYRYLLGFVYSKLGQWEKAASEFRIAVKKEPGNAEYLRGLGWAIYNEGDQIKGLAYLEKANEPEPHNINILNDLSVAYLGMSDLKSAKKYNKLAMKIDPGNFLATTILERIALLEKHWPIGME